MANGGSGLAQEGMTAARQGTKKKGRYKPEYCKQLVNHMKNGYSVNRAALAMGFSEQQIGRWASMYPDEMGEALARGMAEQRAWYEREAIENLPNHRYNGNLFKFLTANMLGWSEKKEIKQETTVTVTVQHQLAAEVIESLPDYAQPLGIECKSKTVKEPDEIVVKAAK